jgi:hypothetical protein
MTHNEIQTLKADRWKAAFEKGDAALVEIETHVDKIAALVEQYDEAFATAETETGELRRFLPGYRIKTATHIREAVAHLLMRRMEMLVSTSWHCDSLTELSAVDAVAVQREFVGRQVYEHPAA